MSVTPRDSHYSDFHILVDNPADEPALGFADYADAFAEIVCDSEPRFAVGIFGGWGSGKTTLMRAIRDRIDRREDVITVWFNAWRYEREPELIIPLLDVLREALLEWAAQHDTGGGASIASRARRAAAAMGAAARAIAKGITVSARLPAGIGEATLDLGEVLSAGAADAAVDEPGSVYHASFRAMADAVEGFIMAGGRRRRDEPASPERRIVVFVDDLDRCLPLNALQVLESMKLFFDLDGFVFVAGLDQQVVERAVELRYANPSREGQGADQGGLGEAGDGLVPAAISGSRPSLSTITGRDYIKKIFQVPFGLPPVDRSQLGELVSTLVATPRLSSEQRLDLQERIVEHLQYYSDGADINAREVKRLINAYTLQAKLLSLRLNEADLDTILALQVIAFRPDWERIWERLQADPDGFVHRLREGIEARDAGTVWVDGEPVPPRLVDYLDQGRGKSLLTNPRLAAYLSSSQASHSSEPLILRAQALVDDLRRFVRDVGPETDRGSLSQALRDRLGDWRVLTSGARWAQELQPFVNQLDSDLDALIESRPGGTGVGTGIAEWAGRFKAHLDRLDNDLRSLRDRYSFQKF
jgi:KAP family P-loop domain